MNAHGDQTILERQRYSQIYLQRLDKGLSHFVEWLVLQGIHVAWREDAAKDLDALLARYIQHCQDASINSWVPKHTVLGLQHRLNWRHRLPRAWACMKSWKMEQPLKHRTPMPLVLVKACFALGLNSKSNFLIF